MRSGPSSSHAYDQYRVLFKESPVPIFVYDKQTQEFVAVSNSVIENYGYSREEILSMKITDLVPDEDLAAYKEYRERVLIGEQPGRKRWEGTWRHKLKSGQIIEIEITGNDLLYDGRECRMAYCADVTARNAAAAELAQAREQLAISERLHRMLFERSPLPVAASDHDTFRYIAVSDALVAKYGYSREELMAMTIFDLLIEEQREEMRAYVAAHPEGTRGPLPGRGLPINQRLKDGTVINVEVTSNVIELDGILAVSPSTTT